MEKSVAFQYTSKDQSKKKKKNQRKNETKETIQFAITSKRIKYLGVNLTRGERLVH